MTFLTKAQIEAQIKAAEETIKALQNQEKNFAKKQEGAVKIKELEAKFESDKEAICKQYEITAEELKSIMQPEAVIAYTYTAKIGGQKTYTWWPGRLGKAPTEFELIKSQGADAVVQYLTAYGREYVTTTAGAAAFKSYMTPKPKKA